MPQEQFHRVRSHFGSSHFQIERARCFSRSRAFFVFFLSQCLQPSLVVSHLISWQVLMMGPMCLSLLCLVLLRIMVLLMVLALILMQWVIAQPMHSSKSSEIFCYPLARGFADFDSHVKTLSGAVGMVTSRIASVEQTVNAFSAKMASFAALEQNASTLTENVNSLTARICKIEKNATSASSGSDSQDHGTYLDIVTAPQPLGPLGPMAQGHLMTVEIRGVDWILSLDPKIGTECRLITVPMRTIPQRDYDLDN